MINFIYEYIFTAIGILLSLWGMIRFFGLWVKTRYFWKGVKFLVCLVLFCAYVVLFLDDLVAKQIYPGYIVILFRPLVLMITLTLILDVPNEH